MSAKISLIECATRGRIASLADRTNTPQLKSRSFWVVLLEVTGTHRYGSLPDPSDSERTVVGCTKVRVRKFFLFGADDCDPQKAQLQAEDKAAEMIYKLIARGCTKVNFVRMDHTGSNPPATIRQHSGKPEVEIIKWPPLDDLREVVLAEITIDNIKV
ncbi:MAG: hypothetical protein Q7S57_01965 [bacterium]|nr:hypothetical protein [bacterium]